MAGCGHVRAWRVPRKRPLRGLCDGLDSNGRRETEFQCFFRSFDSTLNGFSMFTGGGASAPRLRFMAPPPPATTPAPAINSIGKLSPFKKKPIEDWRLATLVLIATSVFLAVCALFVSCCGLYFKCACVAWALLTTIATVFGICGLVVFAIFATFPQNKFVLMTTATSELLLGRSFQMALAGVILDILASILSIACTILIYTKNSAFQDSEEDRSVVYAQYYKPNNLLPVYGWRGPFKQTGV